MNRERTPEGEQYLSGTLGEIFPDCYEKVKEDSKRFCCLMKEGSCEHEVVCFVKMQRAIRDLFEKNTDIIGVKLAWSTDIKRYLTKVSAKTMIHSVFEVSDDKYSPLEK